MVDYKLTLREAHGGAKRAKHRAEGEARNVPTRSVAEGHAQCKKYFLDLHLFFKDFNFF